jgi:phosphoglycolate phosphatase-like HAD superfamily hydrolase
MSAAVLFDVDGTLVKGHGAGRHALARGVEQVLGVPAEHALEVTGRIDYRGSTDRRILEQIFALLGFAPDGRERAVVEAYLDHLPDAIADSGMVLLPGTRELLDALEARGVRVGLLTGNVRAAARLKIAPFGLQDLADVPGGFGDDGHDREEIARVARDRLAEAGRAPDPLIVVGDTEWDVLAARAVGAKAVAVETGWTSAESLADSRPDLLLPDLRHADALFTLLAPGGPAEAP